MPGAGHMYLGLMRRGIEIMFFFFTSIFVVASALRLPEIGVPLSIIIFFYSVFDTYHTSKAITRGENVTDSSFVQIPNKMLNSYHIGIGIIIIGFIFLVGRLERYAYLYNIPSHVFRTIERSIAPLIIIGIGAFMMLKSKKGGNSRSFKD